MHISVKCYATLKSYQPENSQSFSLDEGATLSDLLGKLSLPLDEVKVAFVNGKHAAWDRSLKDGDHVALFPAVGGG
jgi:molybdopterin converting factor small subunit